MIEFKFCECAFKLFLLFSIISSSKFKLNTKKKELKKFYRTHQKKRKRKNFFHEMKDNDYIERLHTHTTTKSRFKTVVIVIIIIII